MRERFKSRAQRAAQAGGTTAYAPLAAYARLLLALGDGKAAAAAFSDALRVAPQSAAALAGRAQALAAAGDDTAALAAYDEALAKEQRAGPRQRLIEAELAIVARSRQARRPRRAREGGGAPPRAGAHRPGQGRRRHAPGRRAGARGTPGEGAQVLEERLKPGRAAAQVRRSRCARRGCGWPQAPRRTSRARPTCSPSWRASFRRATPIAAARSGRSRSRSRATAARCPRWRASWNARPARWSGTCSGRSATPRAIWKARWRRRAPRWRSRRATARSAAV